VNRAGPGGSDAHAKPARVLRHAARHERGGFLMAHADIGDAVPPFAQSLDQRIDAVAHDSEHMGCAPCNECLDQDVRCVQVIVKARRRLRRNHGGNLGGARRRSE
jgi:hypothetical protein